MIAHGGENVPDTRPLTLNWRGVAPQPKAQFALVTSKGYSGLVRVVGFEPNDSEILRADLVHGAVPAQFIAVGPVSGPLEKAMIKEVEGVADSEVWQPRLLVDLDGDGRRDLEHVSRCNTYQPSGCADRVCSEICTGTRRAGESEPARETLDCNSFMPDIDDCVR